MADFSYLSDTDESAVEELISQAKDQCVLEQISAINCSSFTDSSILPAELESRFRKLKSFPLTKPKTSNPPRYTKAEFNDKRGNGSDEPDTQSGNGNEGEGAIFSHEKQDPDEETGFKPKAASGCASSRLDSSGFAGEKGVFSASKEIPDGKRGLNPNLKHGSLSSPSSSSDSSLEDVIFSASKQNPDGKRRSKLKSKSRSFSSPAGSSNSLNSPSPPKKAGCFWCSPKKASHQKRRENLDSGIGLDWDKNDEYLSGLSTFSRKDQQKMLKKAMKEEEKISREAEKIVKWAKQASARLSVSGIEDELSDD